MILYVFWIYSYFGKGLIFCFFFLILIDIKINIIKINKSFRNNVFRMIRFLMFFISLIIRRMSLIFNLIRKLILVVKILDNCVIGEFFKICLFYLFWVRRNIYFVNNMCFEI